MTPARRRAKTTKATGGTITIDSIIRIHSQFNDNDKPFSILDLCDPKTPRYVLMEENNWQLVDQCPINFYRPSNLLPLPTPEYPGDLELLKTLIKVDEQDFEKIKFWLTYAVYPYFILHWYRKAILIINGEATKQKMLIMKVLKNLIDPCNLFEDRFPFKEEQLIKDCEDNYILTYTIPNKISLQKTAAYLFPYVATGTIECVMADVYYRPKLTIVNLACYRPIIVVNNNESLKRPLFHDYEFHINVKESNDNESEEEVLRKLEDLKPKILGGLLSWAASIIR